MKPKIYYLPGHGAQLATGLGEALSARGLEIVGRETRGDFRSLRFSDQVQLISNDLTGHFWHADSHLIANSYGAYLFLHAQASLPSFPGKVLILSPILGEFSNEEARKTFTPPYAAKLRELAESGSFPAPTNAHIHVGTLDWQSMPADVVRFGELTGIPVSLVPEAGHMLPKDYVSKTLDAWLSVARKFV